MIVWTCPDCGYMNLRFARLCRRCGQPRPVRRSLLRSVFGDSITLLLCLVLVAAAVLGLFLFLQHLHRVVTDLLP